MLSRDINNYEGPWIDDVVGLTNPQLEQSAKSMNRIAEDSAQTTRTVPRVMFNFNTTTLVGPTPVTVIDNANVWGEGSATAPVLTKTATGTYQAVFQTSYQDGLAGTIADAESETEEVNLRFGGGAVRGSTRGDVQLELSSNTVTIYVFDSAGALSDLSGGKRVDVWAR